MAYGNGDDGLAVVITTFTDQAFSSDQKTLARTWADAFINNRLAKCVNTATIPTTVEAVNMVSDWMTSYFLIKRFYSGQAVVDEGYASLREESTAELEELCKDGAALLTAAGASSAATRQMRSSTTSTDREFTMDRRLDGDLQDEGNMDKFDGREGDPIQ